MGSDPRLGIPYPEPSAANDVPKDIKAVVDKIGPTMAVDLQGTLAARPAAGVRGRFYTVAGDSSLNNGRWFRDNGTAWIELPAMGALTTYTPTFSRNLLEGTVTPNPQANSENVAEYELHGRYCKLYFLWLVSFTGTASYDYWLSLPLPPVRTATGSGFTQNDGAIVQIISGWTLGGVTGLLSVRHARVMGGSGDKITPQAATYESGTIEYRYR
jgi:hypothetical protein